MLSRPVTLALLGLALAPRCDDPAAAERAKHQGSWAVVSMVYDGGAASEEVVASIRRAVEGDHVAWSRDGKRFAGTRFEVDPSKSPPTIDLLPDGGPARDKRVLGIYRLDGDNLTVCVAAPDRPRPVAFESKPGSKQTLQAFRRIKP